MEASNNTFAAAKNHRVAVLRTWAKQSERVQATVEQRLTVIPGLLEVMDRVYIAIPALADCGETSKAMREALKRLGLNEKVEVITVPTHSGTSSLLNMSFAHIRRELNLDDDQHHNLWAWTITEKRASELVLPEIRQQIMQGELCSACVIPVSPNDASVHFVGNGIPDASLCGWNLGAKPTFHTVADTQLALDGHKLMIRGFDDDGDMLYERAMDAAEEATWLTPRIVYPVYSNKLLDMVSRGELTGDRTDDADPSLLDEAEIRRRRSIRPSKVDRVFQYYKTIGGMDPNDRLADRSYMVPIVCRLNGIWLSEGLTPGHYELFRK